MNWKQLFFKFVSLLGMAATLLVAYGFDRWVVLLNGSGSNPVVLSHILFWSNAVGSLLMAIMVLVLFWFNVFKVSHSRIIGMLYLLVGLFQAFYPTIAASTVGPMMHSLSNYIQPTSNLNYLGAFIAMTGILNMVLPRVEPKAAAAQPIEPIRPPAAASVNAAHTPPARI
jgi:hypothetical protein